MATIGIVPGATRGAGRGIARGLGMGTNSAVSGAAVAIVAIWMGSLATERLMSMIEAMPERFRHLDGKLESPDYNGHVCWALLNAPDMMCLNGQTLIGADIGQHLGIVTSVAGFHLRSASAPGRIRRSLLSTKSSERETHD